MPKVKIDLGTLTNSCFVIMPFSPTYQTEYEKVIRPAVEATGLTCIRADQIYAKPQVTADIWKSLRSARIVVAEFTGRNTNVFYEVGLAHALGKPVIIITRNEDDVPFDLKALRYRYYNTNEPFWGENLKKALIDMLQSVLKEKEFGTVFKGIIPVGKIEYEEKKILPAEKAQVEKPSYDLTGAWQGTMKEGAITYDLNLYLVQKGNDLSGKMRVSFTLLSQVTVLQEIVAGETIGDAVSLYGVSYSYLRQGASPKYHLDTFSTQISSEGNEMSGSAEDAEGHRGVVSLKRKTPKGNTPPNIS